MLSSTLRGVATWLMLLITLPACDLRTSSSTAPTPAPPATPTYTLSGIVSEMTATGAVPIERAQIVDGGTGRTAVTDATGFYSISGLPATSRSLSVNKDGYLPEVQSLTISGDTRLDIELDRVPYYTLSGTVFEITTAGQVPVEGVEVYCDSCGSPVGHTFVYTDASGFYSLEWSMDGIHPLFVRKPGYDIVDPTGTLRDSFGRIRALVRGDTRFDIQIGRP